jgi:hypothetical protein
MSPYLAQRNGTKHEIASCWRVPEQSQAKIFHIFQATLPLYRSMSVFSSLIKPDSTITIPDIQSSA